MMFDEFTNSCTFGEDADQSDACSCCARYRQCRDISNGSFVTGLSRELRALAARPLDATIGPYDGANRSIIMERIRQNFGSSNSGYVPLPLRDDSNLFSRRTFAAPVFITHNPGTTLHSRVMCMSEGCVICALYETPRFAAQNDMDAVSGLVEDCLKEGIYSIDGLRERLLRQFSDLVLLNGINNILKQITELQLFVDRRVVVLSDGSLIFADVCPYGKKFGVDVYTFESCTNCEVRNECSLKAADLSIDLPTGRI